MSNKAIISMIFCVFILASALAAPQVAAESDELKIVTADLGNIMGDGLAASLATDTMSNFVKVNSYFFGSFADVNERGEWYGFCKQMVIANAYEYGLMRGTDSTTFNPTASITIAEAITVAARIHSIYTTGTENFNQGSPWYKAYVDYAIDKGIINADDFLDYYKEATRAEMAYILSRALPETEFSPQNTVNSLPDVNSYTKYSDEIFMLYRAGILVGNDNMGTFNPNNHITRAETAAIISRVILTDMRINVEAATLTDENINLFDVFYLENRLKEESWREPTIIDHYIVGLGPYDKMAIRFFGSGPYEELDISWCHSDVLAVFNNTENDILMRPLAFIYQIVRVDNEKDIIVYECSLPVFEGLLPADSATGCHPCWDYKDKDDKLVSPGLYAAKLIAPENFEFSHVGSNEIESFSTAIDFIGDRYEFKIV